MNLIYQIELCSTFRFRIIMYAWPVSWGFNVIGLYNSTDEMMRVINQHLLGVAMTTRTYHLEMDPIKVQFKLTVLEDDTAAILKHRLEDTTPGFNTIGFFDTIDLVMEALNRYLSLADT